MHAAWADCDPVKLARFDGFSTKPPELLGSGKFGTPCERMQWANASACARRIWSAPDDPAVLGDPPPQAAVIRAAAARKVTARKGLNQAGLALHGPGMRCALV